MVQWLFLYGVHMGGDHFSIDMGKELALPVLSDATDAILFGNDLAAKTAQVTDQALFSQRAVEHGLF
jgi:hypothetical protein